MSEPTSENELWNTPDRSRYFLFPVGQPMPSGDLKLRAGPLKTQDVDAELAAQYEISKDEARVHINSRMKDAFSKVHQAFQKVRNREGEGEAPDPSAVFGMDPGEMFTEGGDSAKEGLKNMVSFIGAAISGAIPDDEKRDELKGQFDKMTEELMSEDGKLAEVLKGAEKGLQDSVPKFASKLEELGESLKKAAEKMQSADGFDGAEAADAEE